MSQILAVKFSDYGPVCYFASGPLVVETGQCVLVETDQGLALGRVAATYAPAPPAAAGGAAEPAPFATCMPMPAWDGTPAGESASDEAPAEPAAEEKGKNESRREPADAGIQGRTAAAALFSSDQTNQPQAQPSSPAGLQRVYRVATEEDLSTHEGNRTLAHRAFRLCREAIADLGLDMKLVDVEMLHDRSKMIFFFTAPSRIDFRELIKSLVREFHTRIELRQIGVRHETQMIGALGNCGQVCCCRRFLRKFAPVTIKMAKEQNLFLNPAKISGICGRLLCCLSYEQKGYEEFHKQCPRIGKRVQTPLGTAKVLRANFFKKSISVWLEEFGEREYTLEEWRELMNRTPEEARAFEAAQQQSQPAGRPGHMRGARPPAARPGRQARPRPEKAAKTEEPPKAAETAEGAAAGAPAGAEHRRPRRRHRKSRQPAG